MTWYVESAKEHWLSKVEELGDRFNPDCGNHMDRFGHKGPPFEMLVNKFGPFEWALGEKEFGIPRWILEIFSMYFHEVHTTKSKEIVRTMFESVPTYTDLEPLRHKFAIHMITEVILNCGHYSLKLANKTKRRVHLAEAISSALVQHQFCILDPKHEYDRTKLYLLDEMMLDSSIGFNRKEEAILNFVEALQNGWTEGAINASRTIHELCGLDVGTYEDGYAKFVDPIYDHLVKMLKEQQQ